MRPYICIALSAFAFLLSACNQQPQGGRGTAGSKASVETDNLLRKVTDFYQQTRQIQFDCTKQTYFDMDGTPMEFQAAVSIERPGRIAIRHRTSTWSSDVVADGEQLSIYLGTLDKFTQSPAPKSLDELFEDQAVISDMGGPGPLLDLLSSDPYAKLNGRMTNKTYVGREKIGESDTHHIRFQDDKHDWEVWISATGDPCLLQTKSQLSKSPNAGNRKGQSDVPTAVRIDRFDNWRFESLSADAFAFTPPSDATKVESFKAGDDGDKVSPLVGKPAPDIELELLNGGHFSLKELKEKKIVVLGFWGTNDDDCVREVPIIARIADGYRDKDVDLCCVNSLDSPETIRDFLQQKRLNFTVGLGTFESMNAYDSFQPILVLIDKAGVVQSVRKHFPRNSGQKLREELDALLAGKDLAAETETNRRSEQPEPKAPSKVD